jgi:hypothetical protein
MELTDTAADVDSPPDADPVSVPRPRTCQCDCRRWAHQAWQVCEVDPPTDRLVRMYFDDTADPRGVYPRDVCEVCAVHIKSARQRGGERMTAGPALATGER